MTDFKPFAYDDYPRTPDRSVAIVLDVASDGRSLDPLLLAPCGGPSLIERALDCLSWVVDAEARFVRTAAPEIVGVVEKSRHRGIEIVHASDPGRQGVRLAPCTHLVVLDARHPFLRPSTLEEAIRLFKVRIDIGAMASCVRAPSGWWFEETSSWVEDARGHALPANPPGLLREAHAFHLLPAQRFQRGSPRFSGHRLDPYPFELAPSEAFRVQSEFDLQLASAWLASRTVTRAA